MYKINVGISACLLGAKVRFDGGHKRSEYCDSVLAEHFNFHPICPEMAIGMGAPRPAIRLVNRDGQLRAEASNGSFDVTEQLILFSEQKVQELDFLSGYILCAKSPTCGMERVRVYQENGYSSKEGRGLFAEALMRAHPLLPVEEEGRLFDPLLRENFIERVFAYHDWQTQMALGLTLKTLIDFHSRYKYLLLCHDPIAYRTLGRLLGEAKLPLEQLAAEYVQGLMQALAIVADRGAHTNVLQHLQGYFKNLLTASQKEELTNAIARYYEGIYPLLVPLTLLRHYLREYPNPYLEQQVYLTPHPERLKLRNGL